MGCARATVPVQGRKRLPHQPYLPDIDLCRHRPLQPRPAVKHKRSRKQSKQPKLGASESSQCQTAAATRLTRYPTPCHAVLASKGCYRPGINLSLLGRRRAILLHVALPAPSIYHFICYSHARRHCFGPGPLVCIHVKQAPLLDAHSLRPSTVPSGHSSAPTPNANRSVCSVSQAPCVRPPAALPTTPWLLLCTVLG